MAERLNDDLIVELLTRLPARSLIRFKCVSKTWHSLISDSRFAKIQLCRAREGNPTYHQRIIKTNGYLIETVHYEALDDRGDDNRDVVEFHTAWKSSHKAGFTVIDSCDGLVCLDEELGRYLLYNPATRQSRTIPYSILEAVDNFFCGFGYDPMTDDYKILQGKNTIASAETEVEIFALKSNSWRKIPHSCFCYPFGSGVYLNGALHWLVFPTIGSGSGYGLAIVSFNLSEEKFKQDLQCPEIDPTIHFRELGVSADHLFIYSTTSKGRLEAWIMNEYGKKESWTKLFIVSTGRMPSTGSDFLNPIWIPLCFTKDGKIVILVDEQLLLFNPEDGTCKPFFITDDAVYAAVYVESLVSPHCTGHNGR